MARFTKPETSETTLGKYLVNLSSRFIQVLLKRDFVNRPLILYANA